MKTLTPRQQRFVDEYLVDLNASAAARRAGYSVRTAEWQGPQLLGKLHVAAAIASAQDQRAQRTRIDADWVLKRLAAMADADLADLYRPDGSLLPVAEWPEVWRRGLVAGVETNEERVDGLVVAELRKVKLADRLKALEMIGRHVRVGAFAERLQVSNPDGSLRPTVIRIVAPKP